MKYLKKFEKKDLYESYINNSPILPNVSYTLDTNQVFYNPFIDTSIYEWIDLGLPSGLLWTSTNVGATKPEEYGLYFAWGETEGCMWDSENNRLLDASGNETTKVFNFDDYKWYDSGFFTKYYTGTGGVDDNLTILEQVDDAAYQTDNTCRMPTSDECQELIDNTTSTWETLNGVNGMRFTSKVDTNKSIFIPAAGSITNSSLGNAPSMGCVWTSSLYLDNANSAHRMYFHSSKIGVSNANRRYGYPVRPVKSIN